MGLIESLAEPRDFKLTDPPAWFVDFMGGGRTAAGVTMNEKKAMGLSAVWAAVRVVSGDIGTMPIDLLTRSGSGGRQEVAGDPLSVLLRRPNPEMTKKEFFELGQGHVLNRGNFYAEIEYNGAGQPIAFWPLRPDRTRPIRMNGRLFYVTRLPNGEWAPIPATHMLHIRGLSVDGMVGLGVLDVARESLGLAKASEEFGARWFGGGSRPSGILTHPKSLKKEIKDKIRDDWQSSYAGLGNAHRTAIMDEGVTWQAIGIPPEQAQFLETRRFQTEEVARWYTIPPHKIGDLSHATFSNIEHQAIGYVQDTLLYWAVTWEEGLAKALLRPEDARYFRLNMNAKLRADIQVRFAAYAQGRQWGWLSANDIRDLEDQPRIGPEGDVYLVPMNMIPASEAGSLPRSSDVDPDERSEQVKQLLGLIGRDVSSAAAQLPPAQPWSHTGPLLEAEGMRLHEDGVGGPVLLTYRDVAGIERTETVLPQMGTDFAAVIAHAERRALELRRGRRSASARYRLQKHALPQFEDRFARVVAREVKQIRRFVKDPQVPNAAAFMASVEEFFELARIKAREPPVGHGAFVAREYSRLLSSYGADVQAEVADELGLDSAPAEADISVVVPLYVSRFLNRHARRSVNQLRALVQRVPEDELWDAIDARMTEWEEKRALKLAGEESVYSSGALVRMTFLAAGVLSMQWVAFGRNCPLCEEMNGRVVSIREAFVRKDETVEPSDSETRPLTARHPVLHAPLHRGCDCVVVAA